jgi:hypothetical protein
MFPYCNIHKFIWLFPDWKTQNQTDHISIGESIQLYFMSEHSGQQIVILTTVWWWQKLCQDQQQVDKQCTGF